MADKAKPFAWPNCTKAGLKKVDDVLSEDD
jgi:hypothetical protein